GRDARVGRRSDPRRAPARRAGETRDRPRLRDEVPSPSRRLLEAGGDGGRHRDRQGRTGDDSLSRLADPLYAASPRPAVSTGRGPGCTTGLRSRPRTMKIEIRTPANAIPAPAQKALTKPSVSAAALPVPEATASFVVVTAMVERTAMPTAPPI